MQEALGPDPLGQQWSGGRGKRRRGSCGQRPWIGQRRLDSLPGRSAWYQETEEPRLSLLQSHSAKRGRVKPIYLGVFQKAGTMAMEACRGQGVSFFSIVKYNLLKSTYARSIIL